LYYYRARYYDPVLKRFIAEDPIGLGGGINRWAYVGGDPITYIVPTGEVGLFVAGVVVVIGIPFAYNIATSVTNAYLFARNINAANAVQNQQTSNSTNNPNAFDANAAQQAQRQANSSARQLIVEIAPVASLIKPAPGPLSLLPKTPVKVCEP